MQYKTQGIIIRRRNFGEADRLLTIYTEKRGKITAIAKGVRRIKSKLAGHLELFYLSDFIIAEGKNIDTITAVETIQRFDSWREELQEINKAYYFAEAIDKFVADNEEYQRIFILLKSCLHVLNNNNKLLLLYFELNLLKELGHEPQFSYCARCHEKLDVEKIGFSAEAGGLVCSKCYLKNQDKIITVKEVKIIRLLLNNEVNIIDKINLPSDLKIFDLVGEIFYYNLEKNLKTPREIFISEK